MKLPLVTQKEREADCQRIGEVVKFANEDHNRARYVNSLIVCCGKEGGTTLW